MLLFTKSGYPLKPVSGDATCNVGVMKLVVPCPIVSDLRESVDAHVDHEAKVALHFFQSCLPCRVFTCSRECLGSDEICLPHDVVDDVVIKKVGEHLQGISAGCYMGTNTGSTVLHSYRRWGPGPAFSKYCIIRYRTCYMCIRRVSIRQL